MTQERTFTIVRKGESITFTSTLDNDGAAKVCAGLRSSFPQDLARKYTAMARLSGKQIGWMHYMAIEQIARDAAPTPEPQSFPGIHELLHRMAERGKAKAVTRVTVYWRTLRLSISGERARVPGAITVTSAEKAYEDRAWYGRIDASGAFTASRRADESVFAPLRELSANPTEQALASEGKVSGVCCRCAAELSKEESKILGFGPTCAKYLGLKHGKRAAAAVVAAGEDNRLDLVTKVA